jgi:hypothetical protein
MMIAVITVGSIALSIMILLFPLSFSPEALKEAKGQLLPSCPIGYQRNVLGTCEPVSNLQTCPVGYQRSVSGICVPISSSQTCPVGYQIGVSGVCTPIAGSIGVNPYSTQPTFAQPSTSTGSLISPTPTTTSSGGEMSPWFPSLPAIACGGTSTMTTIGSLEGDSNDDNGDNGKNNDEDDNNDNNDNHNDNDNDDDKKEYAFQIESDGGPSADPESVDGTVFAGEKNIERNNGRDFDIKDVFNDCQVSMFND